MHPVRSSNGFMASNWTRFPPFFSLKNNKIWPYLCKKNHESIPEYQISDTRFVTSLSVCTVCIFVWSQFAHTRLFNKGSKEGDICGLTFITKLALFAKAAGARGGEGLAVTIIILDWSIIGTHNVTPKRKIRFWKKFLNSFLHLKVTVPIDGRPHLVY